MSTRKILSIVTVSLLFINVNAQEKVNKSKRLRISEIAGYSSSSFEPIKSGNLSIFKNLSSQNALLNNDFSSYHSSTMSLNEVKNYSFLVGFQMYDKTKQEYSKNKQVRFGLNFSSGTNLYQNYTKMVNSVDSQNINYSIDDSYSMINTSDKLSFETSYLYKIRSDKRFSFYSGISLSLGISYNSFTTISHQTKQAESSIVYNPADYTPENTFVIPTTNKYIGYAYQNDPSLLLSTYVPLGIDFRISKKHDFLKLFHLFGEIRPNARLMANSEIKPITTFFMNYGFGLKISRD